MKTAREIKRWDIKLPESLIFSTVVDVRSQIRRVIMAHQAQSLGTPMVVVIDCSEMVKIDSSGLSLILHLSARNEAQISYSFTGMTPIVERTFRKLGLPPVVRHLSLRQKLKRFGWLLLLTALGTLTSRLILASGWF